MAQEQASVTITLTDEISEPLARIQAHHVQRLGARSFALTNRRDALNTALC